MDQFQVIDGSKGKHSSYMQSPMGTNVEDTNRSGVKSGVRASHEDGAAAEYKGLGAHQKQGPDKASTVTFVN